MSFVKRRISLIFDLGTGSFGDGTANRYEVSGLRVSATIQQAGGASASMAQITIYGLSLSVANTLSTLGAALLDGRQNYVTLLAGDDDSGMSLVFQGMITEAWVEGQAAPQVPLILFAVSGLFPALASNISPTSIQGAANVVDILSNLTKTIGFGLENAGVSVILSNIYLWGTATQQIQMALRAADLLSSSILDGTLLSIWSKGFFRAGDPVLVSPQTGMVGYPTHTSSGIIVRTLFNPAIKYGCALQVESSLLPATGMWSSYSITHNLESEMPDGAWFTSIECLAVKSGT